MISKISITRRGQQGNDNKHRLLSQMMMIVLSSMLLVGVANKTSAQTTMTSKSTHFHKKGDQDFQDPIIPGGNPNVYTKAPVLTNNRLKTEYGASNPNHNRPKRINLKRSISSYEPTPEPIIQVTKTGAVVSIEHSQEALIFIALFNQQGRLIQAENHPNLSRPLSRHFSLPQGIYSIEVSVNDQTYRQRIFIQA